jgi:hypothetical protein
MEQAFLEPDMERLAELVREEEVQNAVIGQHVLIGNTPIGVTAKRPASCAVGKHKSRFGPGKTVLRCRNPQFRSILSATNHPDPGSKPVVVKTCQRFAIAYSNALSS